MSFSLTHQQLANNCVHIIPGIPKNVAKNKSTQMWPKGFDSVSVSHTLTFRHTTSSLRVKTAPYACKIQPLLFTANKH